MRDELTRGSRVKCALDNRERPMHCHHEKLVIVDNRVAFVGGIDLTDYSGQRSDSQEHPARDGLGRTTPSDASRGPESRTWPSISGCAGHEVTGEMLPPVEPQAASGDVEVQVVRTVPERIYRGLPRGDFRILEAHQRAFRSAERFIYLENQFLWSPELVATLADAKIGIVDDHWLTIGSANLNEHSLFNDTEMNLVVLDERIARDARRLRAEHLELPMEDLQVDPVVAFDQFWRLVSRLLEPVVAPLDRMKDPSRPR
jgi:phosphatidylserine/phosphatidylglycerophosphate/cardiolipin synthase-like enzyme